MEGRRRFKRKGTHIYLWLMHADVWQKPTQYYEAIILQLKINTFSKKRLLPLQGARVRSLVSELKSHMPLRAEKKKKKKEEDKGFENSLSGR